MVPLIVALTASLCGCRCAETRELDAGTVVRLPVTRDTVVSAYPGERDANLGGAKRLKTKGIVELTLFDVDVAPLRGRTIQAATLHLRAASTDPQLRASVSTVATDWVEGTSDTYRAQVGSASFAWAAQNERPWAFSGSDVTAVINGLGNTLWRFADATPPDATGWQRLAVAPEVVAARVAGVSRGFALSDDVGNEYSREGDHFSHRVFPNRYVSSREAGSERAAYLTVELGPRDRQPPPAVAFEPVDETEIATLAAGETLARWTTPVDLGDAGTIGFLARISEGERFDWARARPVPQYLIPAAGLPGSEVSLHVRDLDLEPGGVVYLGVRALDGAGNRSEVSVARLEVSGPRTNILGTDRPAPALASSSEGLFLDGTEVLVIDPLDKMHPLSGEMIPFHSRSYARENHLWSATERRVRLHAAKNEFVALQLILATEPGRELPSIRFEGDGEIAAVRERIYRLAHVESRLGPLPDPLVPYSIGRELTAGGGQTRFHSFLIEFYIPHESTAGSRSGRLVLATARERLELAVDLRVWDFTLPDYLSFVPQMNAYRLPDWPAALELYRLAHEHRTTLNRLPYNWRGEVEPDYASWRRFDRLFTPLLSGSAFDDMPRRRVPVDAFYLPLNENWPVAIGSGFSGGYWADRALSRDYRRLFVEASADAAGHLQERGWTETVFEFFLNNKVAHKRDGWHRSSAPWTFDEPINTQDFWALRWYGKAFHEGVGSALQQARPPLTKLAFRADISRPEWQRDLLDGVLDVNVVGAGFSTYARRLRDRKRRFGELLYSYGTANEIEDSNVQPAGWCVRTWALGGDGVVPWQTVGGEDSWRRASATALLYPPRGKEQTPVASLRLKAFRRGQQDTEYLTLLAQTMDVPREALGGEVVRRLELNEALRQSDSVDAGTLSFSGLEPEALWRLRIEIGRRLDRLAPAPRRRLVDLRTPLRSDAVKQDSDYLATAGSTRR